MKKIVKLFKIKSLLLIALLVLAAPALSQAQSLKSRSEVVSEVKRTYGGEVLKVVLNQKRKVYQVRVLMPDGRVRMVTVSAER